MKKGRFFKAHPWVFGGVVILLVILFLWIFKETLIETYLSSKMKTRVTVGSISIGRKETTIKKFRIKNPWGFHEGAALVSDRVDMWYVLSNIRASPSIIEKIALENVALHIECQNLLCSKNNWTRIMENIGSKRKRPKEVIVKKLTLDNVDVLIRGFGFVHPSEKKIHFAHLEFDDISSKEGFPTEQLVYALFRSAGLKDYIKAVFNAKGFVEDLLTPFKKKLGENEPVLETEKEELPLR